jgi:AraC family transcriptional regulator
MSLAQKAVWIMERNSGRDDLTLAAIADACGVSRTHLAHAFVAATGRPVMAYLRARRLGRAASALADGAPDILGVALEAGYSSHEAFTRAFRDQFGLTPEALRERGSSDGLHLVAAPDFNRETPLTLAPPRLVTEGVIRVVGLHEPLGPEPWLQIPDLWRRFTPFMQAIPHHRPGMPLAISADIADTDDSCIDYWTALEVTRFGDIPPELSRRELSAQTYAVFDHPGHVSSLPRTYAAIWNEALGNAGLAARDAPGLERHKPAFSPSTGEGGVEIWIPVSA